MSSRILDSDLSTMWSTLSENASQLRNVVGDRVSTLLNMGGGAGKEKTFHFESEAANDSLQAFLANSKEFVVANRKQILSILGRLVGLAASATLSYVLVSWLMQNLDPTGADKVASKKRGTQMMKEIGLDKVDLNEYEICIASNIVVNRNIDCSWVDIGGLENIIDDLRESVIFPLVNFKQPAAATSSATAGHTSSLMQRRSNLIQPPKGILLFGPPGNAKTMIAKALAKESGATFINLQVSSIFDKWFGESQKRVEAIFSLAAKVQPAIIFIDEIDSFLRTRKNDDHECTSTIKTQFMTLWDGLTTNSKDNRIVIVGATNRPEDVDPAILRRMPQMFYIGLPDESQRKKILAVILKNENVAADVDLDILANTTAGFSGSELHELCRGAAMNSFVECVKKSKQENKATSEILNESSIPLIRQLDFEVAFKKMSVKHLTRKSYA